MVRTQLEGFVEEVRLKRPSAVVELVSYDGGGVIVDVHVNGRLFVLAYSPSGGFGVDEVSNNEGLGAGYKHVVADIDSAIALMWSMLDECVDD